MGTAKYKEHALLTLLVPEKTQKTKIFHKMITTIFFITTITLSIAAVTMTPHSTEATLLSDLCAKYPITCPDETEPSPPPSPPPSSSGKFFLATFLQYTDRDAQVNIYKPNMGSEDLTRLRVQNGDSLKSDYIKAALSLPGPAGVSFMSSNEIVQNAKRVKDLGFNFIEFNLESGLSPDTDNNNVVSAMKKAAQATHEQGLKFLAAPSKAYTTQYGSQIAPFSDYYIIQGQSLQDNGIKAYSDFVHTTIGKLEQANPNLKISTQVSTQQGNAPGLSKLETVKQCADSVMDAADGITLWFGNSDLSIVKSFVQWYNTKWS